MCVCLSVSVFVGEREGRENFNAQKIAFYIHLTFTPFYITKLEYYYVHKTRENKCCRDVLTQME